MVFKNDDTVIPAKKITAMVQTLTLPGPLGVGYSPTCYIRTSHSAMRIVEIVKVRSKQTGNAWSTDVKQLTSNCAAKSSWLLNNLFLVILLMFAQILLVLLCLKDTLAVLSVKLLKLNKLVLCHRPDAV